jgi:membrane-associated phospholipid phosphatase
MRAALCLSIGLFSAPAWAGPPGGLDKFSPLVLRKGPAVASDWVGGVTVGSAVVGVGGGALVVERDWRPLAATTGAVAVTAGLTELTKVLTGRRRPYTWAPDHPGAQIQSYCRGSGAPAHPDDCKSFFSGHTALTAASSFSAVRAMERSGGVGAPRDRWVLYSTAATLTVMTGALRVAAGKHYITDVAVGAVVGAGIGILMPSVLPGPR